MVKTLLIVANFIALCNFHDGETLSIVDAVIRLKGCIANPSISVPEKNRIRLLLGDVYFIVGNYREAEKMYTQVFKSSKTTLVFCEAAKRLVNFYGFAGTDDNILNVKKQTGKRYRYCLP